MTIPVVTISLEGDCRTEADNCASLADDMIAKLTNGNYAAPGAVMLIPASIEDWLDAHRTARKRANACDRNGYEFRLIERADWEKDIFRINVSLPRRQGRPMTEGYTKPQTFSRLGAQPCTRHRISEYGVIGPSGHLAAYMVMYRVGALVLVSQLLGHAEHLETGVMYLLFRGALESQIAQGSGHCWYNLWDSGTEGLRFYKQRLGFEAMTVRWEW